MHPTPAAPPPEDRPRGLIFFATSGALDYLPANACDRRFWPVIADRRAANDGQPPTDDAQRNLLVRRSLAQNPRRFTGEPITGFGALA